MVHIKRYKILIAALLFALTLMAPPCSSEGASPVQLEKGVLLVARPKLKHKLFGKSVILIVMHGNKGTLGLIVNRPTGHLLSEVLKIPGDMENLHENIFIGGPVNPHIPTLLIDTDIPPEGAGKVFGSVYFSGNAAGVLNDGMSKGHFEIRAYSGISSWARGQLEMEIKRGDWLIVEPDSKSVFSREPEKVWEHLIEGKKGDGRFLLEVRSRVSR